MKCALSWSGNHPRNIANQRWKKAIFQQDAQKRLFWECFLFFAGRRGRASSVSLLYRTWVGWLRRKALIGAVSDKTAVETARRWMWKKFPVSVSLSRSSGCCRFRPGKSARTDAYRMETAPPPPTPPGRALTVPRPVRRGSGNATFD